MEYTSALIDDIDCCESCIATVTVGRSIPGPPQERSASEDDAGSRHGDSIKL